jgi:outer membrane protein
VLNAQQQVFQTKRDLSRSRYDTIVNGLKLKAAAGALSEADVEEVNRLLGIEQPKPKTGAVPAPMAAAVPAAFAAGTSGNPPAPQAATGDAPARSEPAAGTPKTVSAPEKSANGGKSAKKADSGKKTASRASPKSKTTTAAEWSAVDKSIPAPTAPAVAEKSAAAPVEPQAAPLPVALNEPARPDPAPAPAAEATPAAADGTARVVKFVEPKVPGKSHAE